MDLVASRKCVGEALPWIATVLRPQPISVMARKSKIVKFDNFSRGKLMKRALDNLDRLYQKLLARYGSDDDTVIQLRQELALHQRQVAPGDPRDMLQFPAAAQPPVARRGISATLQ